MILTLKEKLEQLVEAYENEIAEHVAENDIGEDEAREITKYNFGISDDGEVHSHGNSNDCYDDGYNNGIDDGEYGLAVLILQMINEAQATVVATTGEVSVVKH